MPATSDGEIIRTFLQACLRLFKTNIFHNLNVTTQLFGDILNVLGHRQIRIFDILLINQAVFFVVFADFALSTIFTLTAPVCWPASGHC